MAGIETVRGSVDTARLGVTLMHDHIFVLDAEIAANLPGGLGRGSHVGRQRNRAPERTEGARGGHHCRPHGDRVGRYIPRIQKIAAETDLNIVPG